MLATEVSLTLTTCGWGSVCKFMMQEEGFTFLRLELDLPDDAGFDLVFLGVRDREDFRLCLPEFRD